MDLLKKHRKLQKPRQIRQKNIEVTIWKGLIKMRKFDDFFDEQMKDPELKTEYNNLQPEFDVIRAIIDARTNQNLTQKQLSEKTGINQADISKLENGTRNPTINLLKRLADGMDMILKIEFIPKKSL